MHSRDQKTDSGHSLSSLDSIIAIRDFLFPCFWFVFRPLPVQFSPCFIRSHHLRFRNFPSHILSPQFLLFNLTLILPLVIFLSSSITLINCWNTCLILFLPLMIEWWSASQDSLAHFQSPYYPSFPSIFFLSNYMNLHNFNFFLLLLSTLK